MRIKILKYKISEVEDIDDYDGWSVELETIYFQLEIDDVIENVVVKKITEVIDGKFEKYFVNHQNEFSVKTESDSVSGGMKNNILGLLDKLSEDLNIDSVYDYNDSVIGYEYNFS